MRRHAALAAFAFLVPPAALLAPAAARAQWNASAGVDSQALFRGVTLSDGHPSPHAALAYDASSGAYGGLAVARTVFAPGHDSAQWTAYAGYAGRFTAQHVLGWEAGLIASHYTLDPDYDYAEGYVGLLGDGWNLRLHAAPDYFGQGAATFYAQANAGSELREGWHWLAHLGLTHTSGAGAAVIGRRWRGDWRVGVAADWQRLTLQLAWVGAQRVPMRAASDGWGYAGDGTASGSGSGNASTLKPVTGVWQLSANLYF